MPNTQPYDTQKAYISRALLEGKRLDYQFWVAHRIFCHHKRLVGISDAVFQSIIHDGAKYVAFNKGIIGSGNRPTQPFFPIVNVGSLQGNPVKGNRCGVYKLAPGWRGVLKKVAKKKGWLYA